MCASNRLLKYPENIIFHGKLKISLKLLQIFVKCGIKN